MRCDARKLDYELADFFGVPVLFTNARIDEDTVPDGLYMYEVRDGGMDGQPCEVAKFIVVNHWGTLLSKKPLNLGEDGRLPVESEDDWGFEGYEISLDEYMAD